MTYTTLVTGGAGNIGSALADTLSDKDHLVVILDNLSTGSLEKVPKKENVIFIKGDVNSYYDLLPVFAKYNFDYVFHFAAVVGVKRTLEDPMAVLHDIEGIKNILSISKNTRVKRVFYSSSSEVYGEPFEIPQNEKTTPLNSRLPYAIVKNLGEAFFRSYQKEFDLSYTVFRFFNTYGPNQSVDFVIPKFIELAKSGKDITIYGDGMQTRTFCYIKDTIDTIVETMDSKISLNTEINIGNDKEVTVLKLAETIIDITKSTSKIVHMPSLKEGDMTRRCPDISLMKTLLNRDLIDLETGIKKLL